MSYSIIKAFAAVSLLVGPVTAETLFGTVEATEAGLAIDYSTCMVPIYLDTDYQLQGYVAENWRFLDADGTPVPPNHFLQLEDFLYLAHRDTSDLQRLFAEESHNGARCWPADVPMTTRD